MSQLRLTVLGPPRVEVDGQPVTTDRRKALALLVYLAVEARPFSRESLAALFWPDYDQSKAFAYLRRTLWELNQILGDGWVQADREAVALAAGPASDAADFRRLIALARQAPPSGPERWQALAEAAALYRDHFLAGFGLKDAPAFDEWVFFQAEGLRRDLAWALEALTDHFSRQAITEAAVAYGRRWLALDVLNEAAHRGLMLAYARAGQASAALHQYEACLRVLRDELDAAPSAETTALYQRIRSGGTRGADAPAPPQAAQPSDTPSGAPQSHLPTPPTPFVGRAQELEQIASRLADPNCRLLTLVGLGGAGKTRLAIRAAESQSAAFANGAYFVGLAALTDSTYLVSAIADSLGFSFFSQASEDEQPAHKRQLLGFLSAKQLLLVLDNFEHLLAAVDLLPEMLAAAPRLKIMVTSRERLNVQEEWVYPVTGMRVPETEAPEADQEYNAIELFVQAAQRSSGAFRLGQAERVHVVRICQLVEALPLGLELAGAWTRTLPVREIADEISRSLDFLTTPLRNVPQRHQSLRAVFASSWRRLSREEQDIFQRLSVFQSGFRREAAVEVAGATLPVLTALLDKSLIRRNAAGRYDLHEAVRQYAAEKLAAVPDEQARTLEGHSAYFGHYLYLRQATVHGHGQRAALDEIAAEIENVRAGWRWAVEHGRRALLEQYLEALVWFYLIRSRFQEAQDLLGQSLATLLDQPLSAEAEVIFVSRLQAYLGWICFRNSHLSRAAQHIRQSLDRLRGLTGEAAEDALIFAGLFRGFMGDMDREAADRHARASLEHFRARGDRWSEALVLPYFAWSALSRNDSAEARRVYEQVLQTFRELGDDWSTSTNLNELGELLHHVGDYAEARECYLASLRLAQELGDRWATSLCQDYLGFLARRMGDFAEARERHHASLALSREIGDQLGIAGSLDNLGLLEYDLGNLAEAMRLFQEGLQLRRAVGQTGSAAFSVEHIAMAQTALGDPGRAAETLAEAFEIYTRLDWHDNLTRALNILGDIRLAQGDLAEAAAEYRRSLPVAQRASSPPHALTALAGLADVYVRQAQAERAAAIAVHIAHHRASDYAVRVRAARVREAAAAQLSAESCTEAEARGQALSLEDLLRTESAG